MAQKIVTVTLNPTIDGSAEAETIRPYLKIRTSNERYGPGGGGLNVARTILALGGSATAVYLAGGPTGTALEDLLRAAAVPAKRIAIVGSTRMAHMVFERSTGAEYRFVPEGPTISEHEWAACKNALRKLPWDILVASGSLPPGAPVDSYAELAGLARRRGARLVLDTSGPALRAGLEGGVYLVKPSLGELEACVGCKLEDEAARFQAAEELVRSGKAEIVALSLGRDGALLVTQEQRLKAKPPPAVTRSAVGAGDSFVAAMTLALSMGVSTGEAFARGVAAGTAAVLEPGHEAVNPEDVDRLLKLVKEQLVSVGAKSARAR
jgi:6-phosphofructokinase 2